MHAVQIAPLIDLNERLAVGLLYRRPKVAGCRLLGRLTGFVFIGSPGMKSGLLSSSPLPCHPRRVCGRTMPNVHGQESLAPPSCSNVLVVN